MPTSSPEPLQQPHPPIAIVSDGATTFDRVVEFGDGGMPIPRLNRNPVNRIHELRERRTEGGRARKSAPVSTFSAPPEKPALDATAAARVERAIFGLRPGPATPCWRRSTDTRR